jgi:hypothetical protein
MLKSPSGDILPSLGILYILPIQVNEIHVHTSFYIFDIIEFNLLIGQPFERLIQDGQTRKLNICLGKNLNLPISISHSLNVESESYPDPDPMEEIKVTSLEVLMEPDPEEDAQFFVEEEENHSPTLDPLDLLVEPPKPLVELKPLPPGLRYAFLNNDLDSFVIISDKLSQEETLCLTAVLEKYRSTFCYSLHDLKVINPALCTHRIPTDPNSIPSREPQCRLNNTMREVVKKEILKLLHAEIIYHVPHSVSG